MRRTELSNHHHFLASSFKYYRGYDSYRPSPELTSIIRTLSVSFPIIRKDVWSFVKVNTTKYETQGWKIHISATLLNYKQILKTVANICINNKVDFKFNSDTNLFKLMNSKVTSRAESGKFITIYPENVPHFRKLLSIFYKELKSFRGPYILSDRRYKDCEVIYYRYGEKIRISYINYKNEFDSYIESPTGELIPEERKPFWTPPYWIDDVFDNDNDVLADEEQVLLNNRFKPLKVLHFSSSGGVYLALDELKEENVVIKEARPFTGVVDEEKDAKFLLTNEYNKLLELNFSPHTPNVYTLFHEWEHLYMVMEKIEGLELTPYIISENPLLKPNINKEKIKNYNIKIKRVWLKLLKGCIFFINKKIHVGDFSSDNIIISDNEEIKFIDFEATTYYQEQPIELNTVGFRTYSENHSYMHNKIANILLSTIIPINGILEMDYSKLKDMLNYFSENKIITDAARNVFSMLDSGKNLTEIIEVINDSFKLIDPDYLGFNTLFINMEKVNNEVQSMRDSILNNVIENDNIIFPSDPMVFETHPDNLAYGTVGVLYALYKSNSRNDLKPFLNSVLNKGLSEKKITGNLFTGSAGLAYVLSEMGYVEEAMEVMDFSNGHPLNKDSFDVFYGLSGIGLANLKIYNVTKNNKYKRKAVEIAQRINENKMFDKESGGYYWQNKDGETYLGLGRGNAGIALFLHYIYLETNIITFKEISKKAIVFELNSIDFTDENIGLRRENDKQSKVLSTYIYDGTIGLASVLIRINHNEYANELCKIVNSITKDIYVFPGYMRGAAGVGDFLLDYYNKLKDEETLHEITRLIKYILNFKIHKYGLYPGEQLYRMSSDLATGTSGILLFFNRIKKAFLEDKSTSDSPFFLDEYYSE